MAALYASVLFLGVNNASSVQPVVSIERTVFYREKSAGMYSPLPYAAAQVGIFTDKITFTCKKLYLYEFLDCQKDLIICIDDF
uniref:Putative ovule protein n=1 Tax=Solanum chacoense TaxID=4108 RepID=A0A0V0H346_SOLCH